MPVNPQKRNRIRREHVRSVKSRMVFILVASVLTMATIVALLVMSGRA